MDPYHLDPTSSMYTNAPVSVSSPERDRKSTQEVTPSNTPHSITPSSSPPRINSQNRRPVATTPSSTPAAANAHQQQHRWAEGTISALGEATASSPQHKNLTALFEREKAKNKDVQNKKSGAGAGGSSSGWVERLSGGAKGIGKGIEKNDESKGKGGKKEGEKKGFFQKGREGLLAREMERANPSFWRPSG
ncbi:hypothetical protein EPUS_01422 [Endocarpon pusillum Z07020]|uniref:Uncharacterized protein n=1 Tax=Endocarpon pusillum (strain Z07020 / HMAS-L-300199) TaxID=1263415 RepID=U1I2A2_ENDPU|nr:uncharacterized protein EPUS_01422 [Endocarpon pusillum Z07020]ERF76089.1 hypothetical protein EPUS_01422 [Endocarpon pusillum Z07020]